MPEIRMQADLRVDVRLGQDPVELERAVASEGRRAGRELYARVLQAADEQAVAYSGGARQRREPRWLTTLMGRLRVFRYRIRVGDGSFHPLDRLMDLNRGEASAAVRRLVIDFSRRLSYREVASVIAELTGEPFSYQQVARVVQEHNFRKRGGRKGGPLD